MKLPDYITCLNLLSGLLAIVAAFDERFTIAAFLLLAAMVFDAIDGYIARKMNIASDFGAEMDSLSDLVSFGVAPMVLLMTYYQVSWVSVVAVLLPLFGALRLARHNIYRKQTQGYLIGIPITAAGLVISICILLKFSSTLSGVTAALLAFSFLSTKRVNKLLS